MKYLGKPLLTVILVFLLFVNPSVAFAQEKPKFSNISVELEPAFAFVSNREKDERNFWAARPLLQINYMVTEVFEPHMRYGHLFTGSRTRDPVRGHEFGFGTRLHFAKYVIRNPKILKDFRLYSFANLSFTSFGRGGEEFFYKLNGFNNTILQLGVGSVFPARTRFRTKVEVGYARHSRSLLGRHGTVGATALIVNF